LIRRAVVPLSRAADQAAAFFVARDLGLVELEFLGHCASDAWTRAKPL